MLNLPPVIMNNHAKGHLSPVIMNNHAKGHLSPVIMNNHAKGHLLTPGDQFFQGQPRLLTAALITVWIENFSIYFSSSVQFKMVYMHLGKPICTQPHPSEVSPKLPLKQFQCSSDRQWPFLILSRLSSTSSFHTSHFQVINCMMSLDLYPRLLTPFIFKTDNTFY